MALNNAITPSEKPASDLLTEPEAALYLTVEPRTLRDWRNKRGLPHLKLTSKIIRYRRTDLNTWLARHLVAVRG